MKKVKAYIVWLWGMRPEIKFRRQKLKQARLKMLLKKYCDQSPKITPWPYK